MIYSEIIYSEIIYSDIIYSGRINCSGLTSDLFSSTGTVPNIQVDLCSILIAPTPLNKLASLFSRWHPFASCRILLLLSQYFQEYGKKKLPRLHLYQLPVRFWPLTQYKFVPVLLTRHSLKYLL